MPGIPEPDCDEGPDAEALAQECAAELQADTARHAAAAPHAQQPCAYCGRQRTLHPSQGQQWCGTCISREERRINTHEMSGRGRRGY